MIVNGQALIDAWPIRDMLNEKVQHAGVSHGLTEVGYDIRLKQTIIFTGSSVMTPAVFVDGERTRRGNFTLASAMEEFDMPATLCGVVHDKSTWARQGLSVFNTVIEPGWKGFLTLELVYHGYPELVIPAGSGIAQVIFHQAQHPARYNGKYQNQEDRPVAAITG